MEEGERWRAEETVLNIKPLLENFRTYLKRTWSVEK
jgi:hypothetical protein